MVLDNLKNRLLFTKKGYHFHDKIRLLACALLPLIPLLGMKIGKELIKGVKITHGALCFFLLDWDSSHLFRFEFEPWMKDYIKLPKGGVFVDIGAHIGYYTLLTSRVIGDKGLIISVEADPTNYKTLLSNIFSNHLKNIIHFNVAAYSTDTKINLYQHSGGGTGHSLVETHGSFVTIKARRLDSILKQVGVNRLDLVKIDVEGAEAYVLEGAIDSLRKYRPRLIIEVRYYNLGKVKEFLENFDYDFIELHSAHSSIPLESCLNIYAKPRNSGKMSYGY